MMKLKAMEPSIEAEFEAISTDEEETSPPMLPSESEVTEQPVPSCEESPPSRQEIPHIVILSSFDEVGKIFDRPELANLGCSYRGKHERQLWFTCETCFPDEINKGVCLGCAKQCLLNQHDIDPSSFQYSLFYCDAGHNKAGCPKIEGESDDEEEDQELEEEEQRTTRCSIV